MIIFQKPFPGAARTEHESQLQRAVKVSARASTSSARSTWSAASSETRPATARRAPRSLRAAQAARLWSPARVADGQAVGRAL